MALTEKPQVTKENGVTVVTMGEGLKSIDETVIDDVREFLLDLSATADPPRVLIDLSKTEFFGSSFIELLFRVWNRMKSRPDGDFAICCLSPYCKEVLEVTHLNQLWKVFETRDEAIQALAVK